MQLADSNVWLALVLSMHEFHAPVRHWLDRHAAPGAVLFCRATQQSLLRLLTTNAVFAIYGIPALSNQDAWSIYENLLSDERIAWTDEPPGLEATWKRLAAGSRSTPKLWMNAYLAAFALQGRYQLVTTDKAFQQFGDIDLLVLSKA